MVYSTGCGAEDSWRRGGLCALVGNGETNPNKCNNESSATQPVLYNIGAVDFVPFS
jgi:hypothetical protein